MMPAADQKVHAWRPACASLARPNILIG